MSIKTPTNHKHLGWMVAIPCLLILAITACSPSPDASNQNVTPAPPTRTPAAQPKGTVDVLTLPGGGSLSFPRQPAGDGSVMEALAEGPLSLVEGCLRLGLADDPQGGFLVVWPAAVSLQVSEDGAITVLDGAGQVIGRAGETIRLGGGAMEDPSALAFWDAQIEGMPLPACPGPYWIAGQTYPLETVQSETPPADVVHLGMPWSDFSLRFDPQVWEITAFDENRPELQALTHQTLSGGCRLTPNVPVGLGDAWTSQDGETLLGGLTLHTKRFFENGELRFVVYSGFLGSPMEGAVEVHFDFAGEVCLEAAESLFAATEVLLP